MFWRARKKIGKKEKYKTTNEEKVAFFFCVVFKSLAKLPHFKNDWGE